MTRTILLDADLTPGQRRDLRNQVVALKEAQMKQTVRDLTESGDFYEGTPEAWERYRSAVNRGDWETALAMEEGRHDDFGYAP